MRAICWTGLSLPCIIANLCWQSSDLLWYVSKFAKINIVRVISFVSYHLIVRWHTLRLISAGDRVYLVKLSSENLTNRQHVNTADGLTTGRSGNIESAFLNDSAVPYHGTIRWIWYWDWVVAQALTASSKSATCVVSSYRHKLLLNWLTATPNFKSCSSLE